MGTVTDFNPRYVAYCRAKGGAPGSVPAGYEFISWIGAQWRAWEDEHGLDRGCFKGPGDHAAFDAWLEAR